MGRVPWDAAGAWEQDPVGRIRGWVKALLCLEAEPVAAPVLAAGGAAKWE